eukprot:jgi/Picre1/29101/NNA_004494.t1
MSLLCQPVWITSVEFKNALETQIGVQLPSTLVFDYPNAESIGNFVVGLSMPDKSENPRSDADDHTLVSDVVYSTISSVLRRQLSPSDRIADAADETAQQRFVRALAARLGVVLPPDMLNKSSTPEQLVQYLLVTPLDIVQSVSIEDEPTDQTIMSVEISQKRKSSSIIAVVGMAAMLPGGALQNKKFDPVDGSVNIYEGRWNTECQDKLTGDRAVCFAGLLDDIGHFDADAFWLADKEAMMMDPRSD